MLNKSLISVEDVMISEGLHTELIDYTEIALASLVETMQYYDKMEAYELVRESEWFQECLESGYILPIMAAVFEADENSPAGATTTNDAPTDKKPDGHHAPSEGRARDVANSIKYWMDQLITKIRQITIKRSQKYVPWVADIKDDLINGLTKIPAGTNIRMTPFYNGKHKEDVTVTVNAIRAAVNSLNNKTYDDFSFASNIVEPEDVAERSSNLATYIKNYYRFHLKNTTEVKAEVLDSGDLKKILPDMIQYMLSYEKETSKAVNTLAKAYDPRKVENAVEEMYTPHTRLSIEDTLICESILTKCINYNDLVVMEWTPGTADGNSTKPKSETDNQNVKDVEVTDDSGKEIPKEEQKEQQDANKEEEKGTKAAKSDYLRSVEYFVKLVVSGYATACDERFITYLSVIKTVANYAGIKKAKYDKHGNYVSRHHESDANKDSNTESNDNTTKVETTDTKKESSDSKSGSSNASSNTKNGKTTATQRLKNAYNAAKDAFNKK